MRRSIITIISLLIILALSNMSAMAQSAPNLIDIDVSLSCSSVTVDLSSNYDRPVIAQVYAGTKGLTEWNLVIHIGDFAVAGANGSSSKTYTFATQPPNTLISYSVRVYDDITNTLVDISEATRDCDGDANNTSTSSTSTNVASTTVSFLASCNSSGGIVIQPIGGVAFSITSTQITQGTAMAIASGQNVTITTTNGVTAIGTPANAVQLVATDGYSITIPASSCASAVTLSNQTTSSSASVQAVALSCSKVPGNSTDVHVVSAGENLFRIGLRYGIHFTRLASYNGIPDATRIFVGQCISIPPA